MALEDLIKEFNELGAQVVTAHKKFTKAGKAIKTPAYKKKRIVEATALWQLYNNKIQEINKLLAIPDPCFEADQLKYAAVYKDYSSKLLMIPDTDSREVLEEQLKIFLRKQEIRFDSLKRILDEIESKKAINEEITNAFATTKIQRINEFWTRLTTANEDFDLDRGDLPDQYTDELSDMEETVEQTLVFLQENIDNQPSSRNNDELKIERIQLPKFTGDYFKWVTFRDLFCSMAKNKKSMSNSQKMQILKTNLSGEAEALIADLTISDTNFESAWQRLLDRYENNRVVVYKHLHKLMSQPPAKADAKSVKRLLDTTDQMILALKNLGRPTDTWDDWIIIVIIQKLSEESRKDWERKIGQSTALPQWIELKAFLEEQYRMLEGLEGDRRKVETKAGDQTKSIIKSYQSTVEKKECPACEEEHKLFSCKKFKEMEPKDRWEMAKKQKLCFSCLQVHKEKLNCDKKKPCKKCDKKHSTWLHDNRKGEITTAVGTINPNKDNEIHESTEMCSAFGGIQRNQKQVLLATTLIKVQDTCGRTTYLRALVDSGSQGSMITSRAATLLQLPSIPTTNFITGLGGNNNGNTRLVRITIKPRFISEFQLEVECYILKKLTKTLPDRNLCTKTWQHLKGLILADPTFHKVGPIDVLLGTDVIGNIMQSGLIKGDHGKPMAQKTTLGWIISGNIDPKYPKNELKCLISTHQEDKDDLRRFWELEELNPKRTLTMEENACEEHYQRNYQRSAEGKFTVKIPFKEGKLGPERLGTSKGQSLGRFIQLEKRFAKDENLRKEYFKVMNEYISMGHMIAVDNKPQNQKLFYIPHHAVIKPDSLTTKTRVVFDASAKTSSGWSLNECMHTGAKLQHDLMDILTKWRTFKIVFKADIEKMYRMISLDEEDQRYHTIFWRNNLDEPIKEYQSTTVTFGTAAAPFMAIRTLKQIAVETKDKYPLADEIINQDFYVDDLISGCHEIDDAVKSKDEVINALQEGGLKLRKWTSNSQELLNSLPESITEKSLQHFTEDDTTKALGLQWNPKSDKFSFKISWNLNDETLTKRKLLSEAAKLFDPLGWLAPTVMMAKLLMQEVWSSRIGWDEEVSPAIKEQWKKFKKELPLLGNLLIDRWINYEKGDKVQLLGFCDASERAYAAVVYTKTTKVNTSEFKLITSKTRVAPIHLKTTLPKLELCGAVLLANLLKTTKESLQLGDVPITAWSDSTVALGWLQGAPNKWKTFVVNRVSEINSTGITDWRYVKSEENPADCASRGILPGELENHPLWWTGPQWIKNEPETWPITPRIPDIDLEEKRILVNVAITERNDLLLGSSSWFKTVRSIAYCLRMKRKRNPGPLTLEELEEAKTVLYKRCQQETFPDEIRCLRNKQPLSSKSRLLQLNPFIDDKGVMRVGGRLYNALISYENKHPIILPHHHDVTRLIIHQTHMDTLHGGPQLMLGLLRKRYWILNAKRMVNEEFHNCVNCKRFQAQSRSQLMGNLPKERVTLERAFLFSGLDYAGPIEVRSSRLRNAKIQKGYIAVFVCFGTRAVHLELVSDMSTPAFMAAFNRFIARRGMCKRMHSDNGSNFRGTANRLEMQEKQWLHNTNKELASLLINKGIEWKFIPPGAPNFGGIWERGVRSIKDHLKRTLKTTKLTFEEYGTILCQIEACLNSRPLCPLTADLDNLNALTPGHFLIGDALLAPPQLPLMEINANKLDRWKHLQLLQQHFWNRWNREYLNQLQQRHKWKHENENTRKGDLVLVKDEQLPPRNWLMGRIVDTHPGTDGRVRVVTLRTCKGEIKRPISKICLLVQEKDSEQDTENEKERENNLQETEGHDLGPDVNLDQQVKIATNNLRTIPPKTTGYNLRPRKFNTALMLTLILGFIIGLGGGTPSPITTTEFKQNAGIYFEDLGRVHMVKTEWHMYLRFSLDKYRKSFKMLQDITKDLNNLCQNIITDSSASHCDDILGILFSNIEEIKRLNVLLKANGHEPHSITKRAAPLNVIGWASHQLFGIMAADEAERIEKQFDLVDRNSNHLLELITNQTSIIGNTVQLIQLSQEEMHTTFQEITTSIQNLENETSIQKKKVRILGLALFISILVNKFEKAQEKVLDMLTDVQQGHISSYMFTPQQFKEQLELINNNLPDGSQLPENPQHDLKSFYKMIRGSTRVTEKNILVDITLPLVSSMEFQVLHIIPIPTMHRGEQITIIPESEYLLITLKKDHFYQMNTQEFHTCTKTHEAIYICNIRYPIYNVQSRKSQCERELLSQTIELSPSCTFNVTHEQDFWIPLQQKNHWIYGIKNKITLNMVCGSKVEPIILQGSGILEITSGCELMQAGMIITSETIKHSDGNLSFYPTLNLSESVIKSSHKMKFVNTTFDHTRQLKTIYSQITDLKQQSKLNQMHHQVHYGSQFGFILLIGTIVLVWFNRSSITRKMITWFRTKSQNDQPLTDVELAINQNGEQQEIHHSNSVGNNQHGLGSSTVSRHEAGECPFRT